MVISKPQPKWSDLAHSIKTAAPLEGAENSEFWMNVRTAVGVLTRHWFRQLSPEDIEDVQQSVLLKLQLPHIRARIFSSSLRLYYIARVIRSEGMKVTRVRDRERQFVDLDFAASIAAADSQPWLLIEFRDALKTFAEPDRILVYERLMEGRSIAELADKYGVKFTTMAMRLARLFARLRALMTTTAAG
jgi:DNA-directed RNA polymerase specialized sigma24 family protein